MNKVLILVTLALLSMIVVLPSAAVVTVTVDAADVNQDGIVNSLDIGLVATFYGKHSKYFKTPTPTVTSTTTATATATSVPTPTATPSSLTRIPVGPAGSYFLLGANYPWLNYGNDFGGNNGVHSSTQYNADFADMASKGVHVVRWFVLEDGKTGIVYDANGGPAGLSNNVLTDLDSAVAMAQSNHIYLDLVIVDFSLLNIGGHSDVINNSTKRDQLINNVIAPIISRYANNPNILSWELMNEPEWGLSDIPQPAVNSALTPITQANFWDYGSRVSVLAHAAHQKVTVGSAALKWAKVWTNSYAASHGLPALNLDFYQTHYYPWMDCCSTDDQVLGKTTWSPLTQNALALGLDRPIVVGEIPDSDNSRNLVLINGYAGFWPWSYHWDKTGDKIKVDWPTYSLWEFTYSTLVRIP